MRDIEKASDTDLFHLIYDAVDLKTNDQALAQSYADNVIAYRRQARSYRRRAAFSHVLAIVGWAALWVSVLAAVVGIAFGIWWSESNNYAGYDQKHVAGYAASAIDYWYGENDRPPNLTLRSFERSRLYGRAAWKAIYTGPSVPRLCVYVWSGSASQDEPSDAYQVDERATC